MSYLDLPRIHFGGHFQASPSTFNNTPNNYDPSRWPDGPDPTEPTEKVEFYWGPQGNGVFDLVDCAVTGVNPARKYDGPEPLEGGPVMAVHNPVPPKLVDLDPMQQNVSEVWGLEVQVGDFKGAWVRGSYVGGPFNAVWQNSQGPITPRNSQSGGAIYQSNLTHLEWHNPEGDGHSPILADLRSAAEKGVTTQFPKPRLSIRMVVNTHNNKPHDFLFDNEHLEKMVAAGIPEELVARLEPLKHYRQTLPSKSSDGSRPGAIPTEAYVNHLLVHLFGEQEARRWSAEILRITRQPYVAEDYQTPKGEMPKPYETIIPTQFNHGLILGTIGAVAAPAEGEPPEPVYAVPARVLAPDQSQSKVISSGAKPQKVTCNFTPAKLRADALTLDLGNSLPVELPGRPPWEKLLGTLTLECGSLRLDIPYSGDLLTRNGGILDIPVGATDHDTIAANPLAIVSDNGAHSNVTVLKENSEGLSLRADQFVFRMNPARESSEAGYILRGDGSAGPQAGRPVSPGHPLGRTATVRLYARRFGQVAGTEGLEIALAQLTPPEAEKYTLKTLGTGGTKGITDQNISTPPGAVDWKTNTGDKASVRVGADGIARFTITASDPGNPRKYVDGQVYFITYQPTKLDGKEITDYVGDVNDLLSLQIYQHTTPQDPSSGGPTNTTWNNGIGRILMQFGQLYPVMSIFGLASYERVKQNHAQIRRVLEIDFEQALHMPVSRDLSASRRRLVLDWMDRGMPKG